MALSKALAFKGASLTYHKIGDIRIDYIQGNATVGMLSYIDKSTRDADPENNLQGQYLALEGTPDKATPDARAWAYGQITQLDDWKDATSV